MSGASGGEYDGGNVIRPKAFEDGGLRRSGGGLGGDGGDGMLEARVAKLEADLGHIQRDVTSLQTELKSIHTMVSDIRANTATLVERSSHLATREWVMWRFFGAFVLLITIMVALIGNGPRLQALFGLASPSPVVSAPVAPSPTR